MGIYTYSALDYSGQVVKGTIESETVDTATRNVSAKGLYIISIHETIGYIAFLNQHIRALQIQRADILVFTQDFSIMVNAGIPITTCMDDLVSTAINSAFKPVLSDIRQKIECGSTVTAALEAQGVIFPDIIKTLVAVGEETGHLGDSLRDASEHLQRMENLSSAIKKAILYPIFALITTLGALFFWMVFVIPKITETLKSLGVTLPALTRWLIAASAMFQAHWKLFILILLMLPLTLYLMGKNYRTRYIRDLVVIKLPIIRVIALNKLLATFSEQFRMLTSAGISIGRLFDLMIPALGNEYFRVHLHKAKENILNGSPISESLEQQKIFPAMIISKIRIGQTSGTLEAQFDFLSKYYTRKLDNATDNLGKIIEPVLIIVIGGMFVIIIMGLLLPIYDLVSKVGKG